MGLIGTALESGQRFRSFWISAKERCVHFGTLKRLKTTQLKLYRVGITVLRSVFADGSAQMIHDFESVWGTRPPDVVAYLFRTTGCARKSIEKNYLPSSFI